MPKFVLTTGESALMFASEAVDSVVQTLRGKAPDPVVLHPEDPGIMYVGTRGNGLWRSADFGRTWEQVGGGLPHADITAVAIDRRGPDGMAVVYVGTEPSTLSRSEDGGETWREMSTLLELPSAGSWSFPPKPETHHVRWIQVDPHQAGRLYAAIEAGALVRSDDYGETWHDRMPGGPRDSHTLVTHPMAKGRLYSAAGDGYFESRDGGETWVRPMTGLQHRYLVGVAVDPSEPDTVVVSAAEGPYSAYWPANAEAFVYRKSREGDFELAMTGLPTAKGTAASRFATTVGEPGVFYAANNHGLFRSSDGGRSWQAVPIEWPPGSLDSGVQALVAIDHETG